MPERITFHTSDGVEIVGTWRSGHANRAVLMLPMMPAVRSSYDVLAQALDAAGWSTLAIDLRGHGESLVQYGRHLDFHDFNDEEHRRYVADVDAALNWMRTRLSPDAAIVIVGASIGANLAIFRLASDGTVRAAVALSPGLDYRGLTTADKMSRIREHQRLLLVASDDDKHTSWETLHELARLRTVATDAWELHGLGHGTNMLEHDPTLVPRLVQWIDGTLST